MTFRKRLFWVCVGAILAGVLASLGVHLAQRWDVSPGGSPNLFPMVGLPVALVVVFCFGAALLALPLLVFDSQRANASYISLGGFLLVGSCMLTGRFLPDVRTPAFERLGERLMPLVEAIEAYHSDHETYPETLDELAPEYLEELPETGLGNYQKYKYITGDWANDFQGNPWVLSIHAGGSLGFGIDKLLYFPLQNYPERGHGGRIEVLGKWGYVDD